MFGAKEKLQRFEEGYEKLAGQLEELDTWIAEIGRQLSQQPSPDMAELLEKKRITLQNRRSTIAARRYSAVSKLEPLRANFVLRASIYADDKARLDALLAWKAKNGW